MIVAFLFSCPFFLVLFLSIFIFSPVVPVRHLLFLLSLLSRPSLIFPSSRRLSQHDPHVVEVIHRRHDNCFFC